MKLTFKERRMKNVMQEWNLKEPIFDINDNWFTIIFNRPMREWLKTTQKILDLIKENPDITRNELANLIGISEDGIKYHINYLKKKGFLERIGPDKGGYWKIIKGK